MWAIRSSVFNNGNVTTGIPDWKILRAGSVKFLCAKRKIVWLRLKNHLPHNFSTLFAEYEDFLWKMKDIPSVITLFSSNWRKKTVRKVMQNVYGITWMLSLFCLCADKYSWNVSECRQDASAVFKMIKCQCARIRYFRLFPATDGNTRISAR